MKKKIVFMGTPEFAVRSLEVLLDGGIEVAAVVTVPDKPAGRGQQLSQSAVKMFALEKGIKILQPEKLKDEHFLSELRNINADLFVVVAFRMLPELVWAMPKLGTINLHGSLLPQYRGAAPINWAVINGDHETGATTFFIEKEIDTGKIIDRVTIPIDEKDNAGTVHDRLMEQGAQLLLKTVESIFKGTANGIPQLDFIEGDLKAAPKIFKEDCLLDWNQSVESVYNKIRGLSPYPAAWTNLINGDQKKTLKIFAAAKHLNSTNHSFELKTEGSKMFIGCSDGWLEILELQLEGKKRMLTAEFLNGFQIAGWKAQK
ncbi:MAG: methionyl-tRNA formyltransferase [Crocinitomicaceae bacterium]|nr:methionyl-tRNA formyltransferase [Crocinitomicaceae bacterium]